MLGSLGGFLKPFTKFPEVIEEIARLRFGQPRHWIIAGGDGDGVNSAMAGGDDIVHHVPDESGGGWKQSVIGEDVADAEALINDAGVDRLKVIVQSELVRLFREEADVHTGKNKTADVLLATPRQHFTGMGKDGYPVGRLIEGCPESALKVPDGDARENFIVKFGIREAEAEPEFIAIHRRDAMAFKDPVGGMQSGRKIIDQSA